MVRLAAFLVETASTFAAAFEVAEEAASAFAVVAAEGAAASVAVVVEEVASVVGVVRHWALQRRLDSQKHWHFGVDRNLRTHWKELAASVVAQDSVAHQKRLDFQVRSEALAGRNSQLQRFELAGRAEPVVAGSG